jgi:hypothetical protein
MAVSEDGYAETVVPRLRAAGADLARIVVIRGVREKRHPKRDRQGEEHEQPITKRMLSLAEDALALGKSLRKNPEIVMVALDPITSYFGDIDINKDRDVRPVMDSLTTVCNRTCASLVAVIHHNKRSDVDAVQKILGASSVAGASRAAWGVAFDPEDKELRRFSLIKSNLSKKRTGMKFRLADRTANIQGKDIVLPFVEWTGETEEDADDVMAMQREQAGAGSNAKVPKARAWLLERLKAGPVESETLLDEGRSLNYSRATLWRARKELTDLKPPLLGRAFQLGGAWYWKLAANEERTMDDIAPESPSQCLTVSGISGTAAE